MKKTIGSGIRGFSLVEVLLVMTVFSITMGGGLLGVRKGFNFVENGRHYTTAAQILQGEVELLRLLTWPEVESLPDNATVSLNGKFESSVASLYTLTRQVKSAGVQKKEVVINLTWENASGRDQTVSFNTFLTEGGINDYYHRSI